MIHYVLQILAFQLLFLVVYDFVLKGETFFNANRIYLLITPILSFILPLIKIDIIQKNVPPEYMIQLPAALIGNTATHEIMLSEISISSPSSVLQMLSIFNVLKHIWYLGVGISLFLFCYKLISIIKLKQCGTKINIGGFNLISMPDTNSAFTFFNTIFIGETLSETKKTNILLHEKIHVKEYHSVDLIFFEILRIILWFNPLIYIYQKRIATLQEYIADAKAIAATDKKKYYQDLLSQIFQTDKISFINTFFNHSLIKNRIIMLQKSKSKKVFQLKYLLLIPVICAMLVYTSCTEDAKNLHNSQSNTIVSESSPLLAKIQAVTDQIREQGQVSKDEEKALKLLASLVTEDSNNPEELPFAHIDKVPVYPGCNDLSNEASKKCFSTNISQLIASEFNTEVGNKNNLTGKQKIYVRFKIDNTGKVTNVVARAPHPALETEAIRVIKSIPQMKPGIHNGINVGVLYSLPILFELKE